MRAKLFGGLVAAGASFAMGAFPVPTATAASRTAGRTLRPIPAHGQLIQPFNTNTSNNWFGYNQGYEEVHKLFHSITGNWVVPRATQHVAGQAEYGADWIGIGGGCVDANCTVTDNTLIQDGTEENVSASGQASYSAWWEIVPEPSTTISMTVAPGDHMHSSIVETPVDSETWKITLQDVTRKKTFTKTVNYSSSYLTAEWIEETPLVIGSNSGFAPLPKLTSPVFDKATVNGAPSALKTSQEIYLVNSNGQVTGAPSSPDPDTDGFNACAWATSCRAPLGS
jgi:hypothetical protein